MNNKTEIENKINRFLQRRPEISFAYIFGSFIQNKNYHDIDITVYLSGNFNKNDLKLVEKSIEQDRADNPGDLVNFLVQESEVHGFIFKEPWFDVGSLESLEEAQRVLLTAGEE